MGDADSEYDDDAFVDADLDENNIAAFENNLASSQTFPPPPSASSSRSVANAFSFPPPPAPPFPPSIALGNPALQRANAAANQQRLDNDANLLASRLANDRNDLRQVTLRLNANRNRFYKGVLNDVKTAAATRGDSLAAYQTYSSRRRAALHRIELLQSKDPSSVVLKDELASLAAFDAAAQRAIQTTHVVQERQLARMEAELAAKRKKDAAALRVAERQMQSRTYEDIVAASSAAAAVATSTTGSGRSLSRRFKDELLGRNLDRRRWPWWQDPNFPTFALVLGTAIAAFAAGICGIISSRTIVTGSQFKKKDKDRAQSMQIAFGIAILLATLAILGAPIGWAVYRRRQAPGDGGDSSSV